MSENNSREFTHTPPLKVAVIGAGLGGLALAIALNKQGIKVQVYEKAKELRPVGAGLSLFPNGLNVLDAIQSGIVDSLKSAGSETYQVNLKKNTGEIILKTPITLQEKYGQPMLQIRWSRLQEILAAVLPPEIIHLNSRCIGFEQNDHGVQVEFEDGKTVQADILVGADGVNSTIRQQLIGDGLPRYAGRLSWRAIVHYSHELLSAHEVTIMMSPDGRLFTLIDIGDGNIFWSAGALSKDDSLSDSAAKSKSRILEIYRDWAEPVQAIIEATNADDIVERPIWDRPPLNSWKKGRVTLLGDAAHPMVPSLGQGGNTAFEDAWELAKCLCQASSIQVALTTYEQNRLHRTQVIQARSAFQGNRSYDADNEIFIQGVAEQAKASQSEFDDWLYNYKPFVKK